MFDFGCGIKLFVSTSLWPPFGVRRTVMAAPTETFWTFSERTKENLENVPFSNSVLNFFFNIWSHKSSQFQAKVETMKCCKKNIFLRSDCINWAKDRHDNYKFLYFVNSTRIAQNVLLPNSTGQAGRGQVTSSAANENSLRLEAGPTGGGAAGSRLQRLRAGKLGRISLGGVALCIRLDLLMRVY